MASVKSKEDVKAKRDRVMAIAKGSSGEPIVKDGSEYKIQFCKALSYYNAFSSFKDLRGWAVNWCKLNQKTEWLSALNGQAPDYAFRQIGIVCRLLHRGQFVNQEDQNKVFAKFQEANELADSIKAAKEETIKPVIDKNKVLIDNYSSELDDLFDQLFTGEITSIFPGAFMAGKEINKQISATIHEYIVKQISELTLIGEDEQISEGYSYLSKRDLNRIRTALQDLANAFGEKKAATVRKVRAKKVKPATLQVTKVELQPSCMVGDLEIKGVATESLIGAKEVWAWCYKNKNMIVFKSKQGMAVNGTSLVGWDKETSVAKRVKNPEKLLQLKNRVELGNMFAEIETKPFEFTGRLNKNIVLFKVF